MHLYFASTIETGRVSRKSVSTVAISQKRVRVCQIRLRPIGADLIDREGSRLSVPKAIIMNEVRLSWGSS